MENTKQYCGSRKIITTKFGEMTKLSFSKKDLEILQNNLNDKGWVNCNLQKKKEAEQGKPTHYLIIDNYKPTETKPF